MSNFLAIATVTAALRRTLQAAVVADVNSAVVTTVRPDGAGAAAPAVGINIYLYQVTPNAAWRNADLPSRRQDGHLARRPQVALDLHYLVSFYGGEDKFEPQRLLGSAVRTLHTQPTLTRQMIRDTITDTAFDLAQSDLADEVELVRFTPLSLSLEELSKLWSVFFQTPYALSVAYQASVVLIEGKGTPEVTLPVRERHIYAIPFRQPFIEQIMSQAAPNEPIVADQPILAGYTVVIAGKQLRGDVTKIRVAGTLVAPKEVNDTQVTLSLSSLPLPPGPLRAGVHAVQIVHELTFNTPGDPHQGFESNVVAFVLCPTVVMPVNATPGATPGAVNVTVQVNPTIGKDQRVALLLLNDISGALSAAYMFIGPPRNADTATITFQTSGVKAGIYFVRLQVDGAESPVGLDLAISTYGPTVTIL